MNPLCSKFYFDLLRRSVEETKEAHGPDLQKLSGQRDRGQHSTGVRGFTGEREGCLQVAKAPALSCTVEALLAITLVFRTPEDILGPSAPLPWILFSIKFTQFQTFYY